MQGAWAAQAVWVDWLETTAPLVLTASVAMPAMAAQEDMAETAPLAWLPATAAAAALPSMAAKVEAQRPVVPMAMVVLVETAEMVFRVFLAMALPAAWVAVAAAPFPGKQALAATAATGALVVLA